MTKFPGAVVSGGNPFSSKINRSFVRKKDDRPSVEEDRNGSSERRSPGGGGDETGESNQDEKSIENAGRS